MNLEMRIKDIEVYWVYASPEDKKCGATVVAKRDFSEGDIIEVCPIVVLSQRDSDFIESTGFKDACYPHKRRLVLVGGYGPIYNSSEDPNASFKIHSEERALVITADRDINNGEFIYVERGESPPVSWTEPSPWCQDSLVVRHAEGKGLGVYTTKKLERGQIVEVCHLYSVSERESNIAAETRVNDYVYSWGSRDKLSGWAVGYACFYNHSRNPNICPWGEVDTIDIDHLAVRALRDIEPGTELVFDYGTTSLDFE